MIDCFNAVQRWMLTIRYRKWAKDAYFFLEYSYFIGKKNAENEPKPQK